MKELIELKRQGLSINPIRAATGFDRKTIRRYLARPEAIPAYAPRPARPSKLEPLHDYLRERLSDGVWNGAVLLRELQERGYSGGYTILKARSPSGCRPGLERARSIPYISGALQWKSSPSRRRTARHERPDRPGV